MCSWLVLWLCPCKQFSLGWAQLTHCSYFKCYHFLLWAIISVSEAKVTEDLFLRARSGSDMPCWCRDVGDDGVWSWLLSIGWLPSLWYLILRLVPNQASILQQGSYHAGQLVGQHLFSGCDARNQGFKTFFDPTTNWRMTPRWCFVCGPDYGDFFLRKKLPCMTVLVFVQVVFVFYGGSGEFFSAASLHNNIIHQPVLDSVFFHSSCNTDFSFQTKHVHSQTMEIVFVCVCVCVCVCAYALCHFRFMLLRLFE